MDNYLLIKSTIKDLLKLKIRKEVEHLDIHIQAAMNWLSLAQDITGNGGVSISYSFIRGWGNSYPETTGYIIPNFFNYASLTKNKEYFHRAVKMADWELSIQQEDGSFKGGELGSGYGSFVFDTGQVIFGLIAAHKATGQKKYIEGAIRAGNWLIEVQDNEGMWKKYTYHSIPHTYYTRVAWALAELGAYTKIDKYCKAALKNVDWALTKQHNNGWFDYAGFTEETYQSPYTHTIAYTMEGIFETGVCLDRKNYIEAVIRSADSLCSVIKKNKFCHGTYNKNWNPNSKYSCLTGNAQIALVLLRLNEIYGVQKYLETAQYLNRFLCQCQDLRKNSPVRGAISGSYPIWGNYQRFAFPNWAAKFFIDALLLERKLTNR